MNKISTPLRRWGLAMFQGRNFRINRVGKNRYEFRSQYAIRYGTATEITAVIAEHTHEARQSALELTEAKRRVLAAADEDGVAATPESVPSLPPRTEIAVAARAVAAPPEPETAPKPMPRRARRKLHGLAVVEFVPPVPAPPPSRPPRQAQVQPPGRPQGRRKPMRYGLAYLNALRAQEEAEKAR